MNAFTNAIKATPVLGTTFNGAVTHATSGSKVLDFFNAAGNRDVDLSREFNDAFDTNPKLAFRVALWLRDIREGAGERATFRRLLKHFEANYPNELIAILPKIPELGRWDDLLIFTNESVKTAAYDLIRAGLNNPGTSGLVAKWLPRKGRIATELSKHLGYGVQRLIDRKNDRPVYAQSKKYRKAIAALSKTVESQMCAKDWEKIVFDHVPSLASARYQKAFGRNCKAAYAEYKAGLVKVKADGTTERKINTGAVYPYDIVKSIRHGDESVADAQWQAMPDFIKGDFGILPLIDVSGSMGSWGYYGQRNNPKTTVTPMDVAISIGLYTASKQKGAFKDTFLSFESTPVFHNLSGPLSKRVRDMERTPWGGSTNIQAAFDAILRVAVQNNVPQEDMPKILLIVSDMEFNGAVSMGYGIRTAAGSTNWNVAKQKFAAAGYDLPQVVFWSLNGRADNNPVKQHETGAAIVSGFSPAIFKSILSDKLDKFTPESVMLETLMKSRYDVEGVTV